MMSHLVLVLKNINVPYVKLLIVIHVHKIITNVLSVKLNINIMQLKKNVYQLNA